MTRTQAIIRVRELWDMYGQPADQDGMNNFVNRADVMEALLIADPKLREHNGKIERPKSSPGGPPGAEG